MSHGEQTAWVRSVKAKFPEAFHAKRVLEIGSYNVNGTVRDLFTDCEYIGIDVAPGPGVDVVSQYGAAQWLSHFVTPYLFDTIISCECLEHDPFWRATLAAATAWLTNGGLLVLTCAARARGEHGTTRTSPADIAPGSLWPDYYTGLDEVDLRSALDLDRFSAYEFGKCDNPADTYLWATKK